MPENSQTYTPRHRDGSVPVDALPNNARCTCRGLGFDKGICPRHNPSAYADCMARHATDSIGPVR